MASVHLFDSSGLHIHLHCLFNYSSQISIGFPEGTMGEMKEEFERFQKKTFIHFLQVPGSDSTDE